jgi:serine/threonine-protein kinase HipA
LGGDAQLAPAYDIVNTTAYIEEDSLALRLAGSQSLFGSRLGILDLASACNIQKPQPRIKRLIAAVHASLEHNAALAADAPRCLKRSSTRWNSMSGPSARDVNPFCK